MVVNFVQYGCWYGSILLEAILLAKLWRLRLARRYSLLTGYLAFDFCHELAFVYLRYRLHGPGGERRYAFAYFSTEPVLWVLYFLIILEIYSEMLGDFPGLRRLGRLVMLASLAGVGLACCLLMIPSQRAPFDPYPVLSYFVLQQRSVFLCLGGVVLLLLLFVAHYRLEVRRNVWVLCASFGGYFVSSAALFTLRDFFGSAFAPVRNVAGALFHFSALAAAVLCVSRRGEQEIRPIRPIWATRDEELETLLASQLRGFNQILAKVFKS